MLEKFQFSDAQPLGTLDNTGVVSDNYWDFEENAVADGQLLGWIEGIILSSSNAAGDEGLWIECRSADATNLSTTPLWLGAIKLTQDEIATGTRFCFGVCKANLETYIGLWYRADTTSLDGATSVDAWFSTAPSTPLGIQKKNTSTGAS